MEYIFADVHDGQGFHFLRVHFIRSIFTTSPAVEEVVGKVKSLLNTSHEWEQKAKAALKQK